MKKGAGIPGRRIPRKAARQNKPPDSSRHQHAPRKTSCVNRTLKLLTSLLLSPLAASHAEDSKSRILIILADDVG